MRPLEQYVTLRRGHKALLQQEQEEWKLRAALLRKWSHELAHWLGLRLVLWGYKLQQVGVPDHAPSSH